MLCFLVFKVQPNKIKKQSTLKGNQCLLDYREKKLVLGLKIYTRSIIVHSLKGLYYNSWLPDEAQGQWPSTFSYSLTAT